MTPSSLRSMLSATGFEVVDEITPSPFYATQVARRRD
jgi:hypothetical protein